MGLPLKVIAGMIGINAKEFIEGWYEGHKRFNSAGAPHIVPGSHHPKGSVAYAASEAAVSFYVGRATH